MRQFVPRRSRAVGALAALAVLGLALQPLGAEPKKKPKHKTVPIKVEETVGDIAFVMSGGEIDVEGVGLVVGLDNTGADAPPSNYRKELVDQMGKAGVEHPERLLASPRVSMVIVRMTIPLGAGPKDPLDVQVEIPPACATKSLAGGHLLTSRLYRMALGRKGEILKDHELGWAQGPVMIGTSARPNDPKVGRVLGGGHPKKDYPYTLVIKENRESFHTSAMLEDVVNTRFQETVDGHQKGAATAKTPSYLVLRVPPKYHQNQERYFRIVQLLPMIDTPELRVRRLAQWEHELLDPATAGVAALKLEGLGTASTAALQAGLKSENPQVRFFSAEVLAYLDDTSGVNALGETIRSRPEFRAYGLAALASLDQAASHMKLRKLMDEPDIEVRYGAFNALRTLDPHDPFLGHVRVLEAPKAEEADEDEGPTESMSLAIARASRRRPRLDDPFDFYVVDSEGPPTVHVSRTRRAEIVLFGRNQKLLPPIVLGTGAFLLNASDGDERIELSKIVPSRSGNSDTKMTTSLEINNVVREIANLGASYPEIVTILENANRQKNLPGPLMIDALPASNMVYLDAIMGRDVSAKRDPAVGRASRGASRPRWRRLFGLFNREPTTNPSATETATARQAGGALEKTAPAGGPAAEGAKANGPAAAVASATETTGAPDDGALKDGALKDGAPAARSAPKVDDGIRKTAGDEERAAPRRRRLLDFLRRDADD